MFAANRASWWLDVTQLQVLLLNITPIYFVYVETFQIYHAFCRKEDLFPVSYFCFETLIMLNDQSNSSNTEVYKLPIKS